MEPKNKTIKIALFEPDIPQNTGSILRLIACFGLQLDIIGPCGFLLSEKKMRRSGMDYIDTAYFRLHESWDAFQEDRLKFSSRLILATTSSNQSYNSFKFERGDIILFGRESAGVPKYVHEAADKSVHIPIISEMRSLNIVQAASILVGESLRQLDGFPNSRIICSAKPKL